MEAIFKHNPEAVAFMRNSGAWQTAEIPTPEAISALLDLATAQLATARFDDLAIALYHILMDYRTKTPDFFPVHDLQLLLANAAFCMGKGNVGITSASLLPAAVLLAGKGRAVTLAGEWGGFAEKMAELLPGTCWEAGNDADILLDDSLLRGEEMSGICGDAWALALCGWDFLGARSKAAKRQELLENGCLQSILQLPMPRKQKTTKHPAALLLSPEDNETVRLSQISEIIPGPGALNQTEALNLIFSGGTARPTADLLDGKNCLLTPAAFLGTGVKEAPLLGMDAKPLRELADILRCQIERKPAKPEELETLPPAKPILPDGGTICREIGISEISHVTGFVDSMAAPLVKMSDMEGRFLLKPGDIVMIFRGSANMVGKVGLVIADAGFAVTMRSICIIRAKENADPTWLYYNLRQPDVQARLTGAATGAQILNVPFSAIKELMIPVPDSEQLKAVHAIHGQILADAGQIAALGKDIGDRQEEMRKLLRRASASFEPPNGYTA